jgi:hypothetical protein
VKDLAKFVSLIMYKSNDAVKNLGLQLDNKSNLLAFCTPGKSRHFEQTTKRLTRLRMSFNNNQQLGRQRRIEKGGKPATDDFFDWGVKFADSPHSVHDRSKRT